MERPAKKYASSTSRPGFARGLRRSLAEIERWTAYSDAERARIMAELPKGSKP